MCVSFYFMVFPPLPFQAVCIQTFLALYNDSISILSKLHSLQQRNMSTKAKVVHKRCTSLVLKAAGEATVLANGVSMMQFSRVIVTEGQPSISLCTVQGQPINTQNEIR